LDKSIPFKGLEHDIYYLRNEGRIILLGDFNPIIENKQATFLSNISNPNPLSLEEDLDLMGIYKRTFEHLVENLFGTEVIKLCSCHDLIICINGLKQWSNLNQITCIHGHVNNVFDYGISNIMLMSEIHNINFRGS
jgi:hypothetical protein